MFGDLHGSLHLFDEMIKKISLTKDDLVIILGDSCDRGKDSIGLYIRYTEMIKDGYNIKHIMGNHEYMFLNHYLLRGSMTMQWVNNGGYKTVKSIEYRNLTVKDLKWLISYLKTMPHMISSKSYIFVHAYYNPSLDETKQDPEHLMWSRSPFWLMNNTGKEIYYGHTPNRDNKIKVRENNCYSMDVGAVFFDNLSIMEVKSKEVFLVG
ncbi:metallophosphoesterase family protein [Campylobacter sp. RM16192]|uniref:metallophosphoesterase family protein n=1 Tax=Campylobacter sp. RM16192 TaxID=1660080 RepID=UPI001451EF1E|nr:metallophosphoesterase family protein [Campylobacter sp. RM16192]QCD52123.1 metallophosphatase [Campylobacter sp. RM16192]